MDMQAGQRLQFIKAGDVEGISGGDGERAILARQGEQAFTMHKLLLHLILILSGPLKY